MKKIAAYVKFKDRRRLWRIYTYNKGFGIFDRIDIKYKYFSDFKIDESDFINIARENSNYSFYVNFDILEEKNYYIELANPINTEDSIIIMQNEIKDVYYEHVDISKLPEKAIKKLIKDYYIILEKYNSLSDQDKLKIELGED